MDGPLPFIPAEYSAVHPDNSVVLLPPYGFVCLFLCWSWSVSLGVEKTSAETKTTAGEEGSKSPENRQPCKSKHKTLTPHLT